MKLKIKDLSQAILGSGYDDVAEMTIMGVDEEGQIVVPEEGLQYWPETINISMSGNYPDKEVLGGSHSLKNWVSTTGREVSLTFVMSRDIQPLQDLPPVARGVLYPQSAGLKHANHDIRRDLDRLQMFLLPDYEDLGGIQGVATPPPVIYLNAPNLGWAINGTGDRDTLIGVMTSLNIVIRQTFPSGVPRLATADVTISETVQIPGSRSSFASRTQLRDAPWFNFPDRRI